MKKFLLPYLLCLLLSAAAFAQAHNDEAQLIRNINAEKISEMARGRSAEHEAQVYQSGSQHHALINQSNISVMPNTAFINQVGSQNNVRLNQSGLDNHLNATQIGAGNTYRGDIDGVSNNSTVLQQGTSNEISQTIQGRNLDYSLIQIGHNNTINQIETTSQSRPYQVIQKGNNMNITIEQSQWATPVIVK